MRGSALVGLVLVFLGLVLLFSLRDLLLRLIILAIAILGIVIGFVLVVVGLGVLFGGWWMSKVPFGPRARGGDISFWTVFALRSGFLLRLSMPVKRAPTIFRPTNP